MLAHTYEGIDLLFDEISSVSKCVLPLKIFEHYHETNMTKDRQT